MKVFAWGGLAALAMTAALASAPASAAPANGSGILNADRGLVTDVQYRRRHVGRHYGYRHGYRRHRSGRWIGPAIGFGIAAGALGAGAYYDRYYGDPNVGYGSGYRCYTDEGQGRMRPCDAGGAP